MKKLFSVSCIFIYLFIYLYLLPHLFTDVDHDVHLKQVSTGIDLLYSTTSVKNPNHHLPVILSRYNSCQQKIFLCEMYNSDGSEYKIMTFCYDVK